MWCIILLWAIRLGRRVKKIVMKQIKILTLLKNIGKSLNSFGVENLLNQMEVRRRPYLDENDIDEGRYNQWLPIKKLGLELGFKSQAIFEQCDENKVKNTPLLLTSYIFYADKEGMKPYAYELPYGLKFTDTSVEVQEKMKNEKAHFREYIRDVWDFDTHQLIVGYNEERTVITNIVYMLSPKFENQTTSPLDIEKAVTLFGKDTKSIEVRQLMHFFDLDDFLGEQKKVTPRYLAKEYGIGLSFTDSEYIDSISQKGHFFSEIILYDTCYLDFSHGYRGKLPFGLEFTDAPYEFINKVSEDPVEIFEYEPRMEGHIMWVFSSLSLRIVYSLLTNKIARIHIYPTWIFSEEDKNDWELDKDTLLFRNLNNAKKNNITSLSSGIC